MDESDRSRPAWRPDSVDKHRSTEPAVSSSTADSDTTALKLARAEPTPDRQRSHRASKRSVRPVPLLGVLALNAIGALWLWSLRPGSVWSMVAMIGITLVTFTAVVDLTQTWRQAPVRLAGAGLLLVGVGAFLTTTYEVYDKEQDLTEVFASRPSWGVVLAGGFVLLTALVWALARQSGAGDRSIPVAVGELTVIGIGYALLAAKGSDVVVGRVLDFGPGYLGRPRRRQGSVVRAEAPPHRLRSVHDVWARAAVEEHHSVEAFETLAARLHSVGAPEDLVVRSHAAARDEVRHAATCRRFAGVSPAPPVAATVPSTPSPRTRAATRVEVLRLAIESYVDGVVGEGIGAELLRRGADTALPQRRAALAHMAADEQRHAELAEDIVTWAHATSPRLVRAALFACDRQLERQPLHVSPVPLPDETLRSAGLVPASDAHELAQEQRRLASTWLRSAAA